MLRVKANNKGRNSKLKSKINLKEDQETISFSEQDAINCIAAANITLDPLHGGRVNNLLNLYFKDSKHYTGLIFTKDEPEHYDVVPGNTNIKPKVSNNRLSNSTGLGVHLVRDRLN